MQNYDLDNFEPAAKIVVIGVGGAGNNAVNRMIDEEISNVDFYVANTDKQALASSKANNRIILGEALTGGLGAGGEPEMGEQAAEASADDIREIVKDANMVFVAAGMGGGTGTGATPVIAERAQSMGIMTFVIAVEPFSFETARIAAAKEGIAKIRQVCPNTIVVSNDLMIQRMPDLTMRAALDAVNASIASFIERKIALIKECFESEFEAISAELLEESLSSGTTADLVDSIRIHPKTAKE